MFMRIYSFTSVLFHVLVHHQVQSYTESTGNHAPDHFNGSSATLVSLMATRTPTPPLCPDPLLLKRAIWKKNEKKGRKKEKEEERFVSHVGFGFENPSRRPGFKAGF